MLNLFLGWFREVLFAMAMKELAPEARPRNRTEDSLLQRVWLPVSREAVRKAQGGLGQASVPGLRFGAVAEIEGGACPTRRGLRM